LSRRSPTERLAPASKDVFENAFNVSGGWDKAECDGHEIYNWEVSEPATFPVFLMVKVTATSMSLFLMLGSDTFRPEYWKVV
jgi:hypothetical protein